MKTFALRAQPEKDLEKWFVEMIGLLGGECLKMEVRGRRGWPDRICIMPGGITAYVELKARNGRMSRAQEIKGALLREMGHLHGVVWDKPGGLEMLARIENAMNRRT